MAGLTVVDLKDLVIPTRKVEISPGVALEVRGLSIEQLTVAFGAHLDLLDALLDGKGETRAGELLQKFPDLVATIIATAAGRPEEAAKVKELGTQVQLVALMTIFDLSFPDKELLGKFWARVEEVLTKLAQGYAEKAKAGGQFGTK